MNRYARTLVPLILVASLPGCASTTSTTDSAEPTSSATAEPVITMSLMPTSMAQATPTHDMGGMGDGTATVQITNFAFAPETLTIDAGTEVTFTNNDAVSHTVTAGTDDETTPDLFDSGSLAQGESFTFVFDEPGTYVYYCDIHPMMEGSITVES